MSEEQQSVVGTGTTGPADDQTIGGGPSNAGDGIDPTTDPTAAQPDPDTGLTAGVNRSDDEDVTEPHPAMPGYGVTGKFPTQDADVSGDTFDAGEPIEDAEPPSETDALAVEAPAPVTAELPAAEADQLDVPADQRGDTA